MKKQKFLIEIITLILYVLGLTIILYYHEPCFDEAQAWLIARDATITQLLTSITHYEGHPPVWFLILMPFAKSGIPFEIGIKTVNFTIAAIAMGILIFKAPFYRIFRCTIPFTYYFFYQYGVISRNYSLMMLGFVLSALFFKYRNEKPFRFVAALSLICGASVYGIVISAGIAVVWLWEIVNKKTSRKEIKLFLKSRRFYALLILLIYNIFLLISIYPYNDTYAIDTVVQNRSKFVWLFYMFFIAPADAICSSVYTYGQQTSNLVYWLIPGFIISYLINITMFEITKMFKKQALFIVPYFLFALLGGLVYFYPHHIGILTTFYIFLLWCCFAERSENFEYLARHKIFKNFGIALMCLGVATSMYWSITAARNEIALNYGTGRETAEFIKENELDRLNIMVAWRQIVDPDTGRKYFDYNYLDGTPTLAYFDKNIFINFNDQANNKCYLLHKIDTDGFRTKKLIENGYPDVLYISSVPDYTFGEEISIHDYALVESVNGNTIWKDQTIPNKQYIFIRNDLLSNYPNLQELELEDELIPNGGSWLWAAIEPSTGATDQVER